MKESFTPTKKNATTQSELHAHELAHIAFGAGDRDRQSLSVEDPERLCHLPTSSMC